MGKLKFQGTITKIITQKLADYHKKNFPKNFTLPLMNTNCLIEFDMISFSGALAFKDQILSIFSFLYYAGIPKKWTIYSDKSYTDEHKQFFTRYFPFVTIVDWDVFDHVKNNSCLNNYLKVCHLAKKINVILGHEYDKQTIYVDSDVIFYKHISSYLSSEIIHKGLWYISDTLGDVENYFEHKPETIYPLNSGFLILNKSFKKDYIFNYFESLNGNYHYFSEQFSLAFAFAKQDSTVLDPRQFVVDTSDQFDFAIKYSPGNIAMRHYISPVRHKIWQKGWRWNFQ